jgi:iron complex transport system ATP-binding protein
VSAGYGNRTVLKGVSLSVASGERISLVGPNGSGKSTFLAALSGLIAYSGTIRVDAVDLGHHSARDRARLMATLPQREHFSFPFRVREIVAMARYAISAGGQESPADAVAILNALEVTQTAEFADRPITALSGGEVQRVLLARALAQETPILLLDEPNTGLDPRYQTELVAILNRAEFREKTLICAIHDLNLAAALAPRMLVMKDGELVADGGSEAILSSDTIDRAYSTRFRRLSAEGVLTVWPAYDQNGE